MPTGVRHVGGSLASQGWAERDGGFDDERHRLFGGRYPEYALPDGSPGYQLPAAFDFPDDSP